MIPSLSPFSSPGGRHLRLKGIRVEIGQLARRHTASGVELAGEELALPSENQATSVVPVCPFSIIDRKLSPYEWTPQCVDRPIEHDVPLHHKSPLLVGSDLRPHCRRPVAAGPRDFTIHPPLILQDPPVTGEPLRFL